MNMSFEKQCITSYLKASSSQTFLRFSKVENNSMAHMASLVSYIYSKCQLVIYMVVACNGVKVYRCFSVVSGTPETQQEELSQTRELLIIIVF